MTTDARTLIHEGLWRNNPALVQLLGLCPLLAISTSVVNALGLGLATILVLMASSLLVSLVRRHVSDAVRLPAFVLIIASFVTCAELLLQAFAYPLYLRIGIFIPLIVTNCTILGRAVGFAARNAPLPALIDGLMMGLGFTLVLVILGGIREALGNGTLLHGAERLFGPVATNWQITLFSPDNPFLLAILPPGAFLGLGFLIALKNIIDKRLAEKAAANAPKTVVRARVTAEN